MKKTTAVAALTPLALAGSLAVAAPVSAAPQNYRDRLSCDVGANVQRDRDSIRVTIRVGGSERGRQRLLIRIRDNGRTVAFGSVRTRLPFWHSERIRNRRGPDRIVLEAVNLDTNQRCRDRTVVFGGGNNRR